MDIFVYTCVMCLISSSFWQNKATESPPRRFSRRTTLIGQLRQILLVTHNSLLNGLANLYVHNNLEIFIQKIKGEDDEEDEKKQSGKGSLPTKCGKVSYMTSDVRQRTLVRQLGCYSVFSCVSCH